LPVRDPEPTSICGSWGYCTRRIADFQEFRSTKRFFVAQMQQTAFAARETLWLTLYFLIFIISFKDFQAVSQK
jgi:hypothetical protein